MKDTADLHGHDLAHMVHHTTGAPRHQMYRRSAENFLRVNDPE